MPGDSDKISLLLQLAITNSFASNAFDHVIEREGFNETEAGLLDFIYRLQPVTPTRIQREMGYPGATLRQRMRRLETEGLIEKLPNPDDARSYFIKTTPAGTEYAQLARRAVEEVEARLSEGLGWSVEELRGPLEQLRATAERLVVGDRDPETGGRA